MVHKCFTCSGTSDTMQRNPAYIQTTPIQPSIQYSSLGLRDTPTEHTPPQQGGEERIYHVLEQPEEEGEGGENRDYQDIEREEGGVYHMLGEAEEVQEGVYHVLGEVGEEQEGVYHVLGEEGERGGTANEVPIQTKTHSTLQHN